MVQIEGSIASKCKCSSFSFENNVAHLRLKQYSSSVLTRNIEGENEGREGRLRLSVSAATGITRKDNRNNGRCLGFQSKRQGYPRYFVPFINGNNNRGSNGNESRKKKETEKISQSSSSSLSSSLTSFPPSSFPSFTLGRARNQRRQRKQSDAKRRKKNSEIHGVSITRLISIRSLFPSNNVNKTATTTSERANSSIQGGHYFLRKHFRKIEDAFQLQESRTDCQTGAWKRESSDEDVSISNTTRRKESNKQITNTQNPRRRKCSEKEQEEEQKLQQSLNLHNAAMIEYYHQHTRYHLFKWHKSKHKRDLNNAVKHNLKLNNELNRLTDPSKKLLYIEQLVWTLRTVTNGIMLPRSDGQYKELGKHEIDLINGLTPPLLKTLTHIEKKTMEKKKLLLKDEHTLDVNKFTQVQLYIAELLGFQISAFKDSIQCNNFGSLNQKVNRGSKKHKDKEKSNKMIEKADIGLTEKQNINRNYLAMTPMLPHVKRMSNNIESSVKNAPHVDSGMPYVIKGMYHMNCPGPLRNLEKAKENFLKALRVDNKSGRNHYFVGIMAFMDGNYDNALSHFHKASTILKSSTDNERNYFLPELERGMNTIRLIKQGKGH
jgi:tetratricopeptide (TPR) repeat protein